MKEYTLTITQSIIDSMIKHAKDHLPIESCGYLTGIENSVTTFHPMTNIDNSPEHFSFDPKEQFAVVKKARQANEKILAVYHSHPETPARLSEEDLKLFNDPDPVYIIVSLMNKMPRINGFKVIKPDNDTIEIFKVNIIKESD